MAAKFPPRPDRPRRPRPPRRDDDRPRTRDASAPPQRGQPRRDDDRRRHDGRGDGDARWRPRHGERDARGAHADADARGGHGEAGASRRHDDADARGRHGDAPRGDRPARRHDAPRRGDDRGEAPAAGTAWEDQAGWYDARQGERGDDFYRGLIIPAALRQLGAKEGERVLDVCCGQGVLGRALAQQGVRTLGVDASPSLIAAARARAGQLERYEIADARDLGAALGDERCDHAALIMALQDLDPIAPVLAGVARRLPRGGRVVAVLTHPCFRIPKRSSWGWDERWGIQYRRVDAYLSPASLPIKTHPGRPADSAATTSFHRPLSVLLAAFGGAGLGVVAAEELCSERRGTQGPRFAAEDRAAREIPVFLVLAAVKLG